jgi:acetolactate synthase-1/2/3 large subunit
MALAAAICDSTLPTLAFVGDGGIGMYLAEVRLAVKLRLPVLLILMSDNSFGSIRTRAIKDKLTQKPLMMDGSSWVPVLNGFGIPSTRVENLAELDRALKSWDIQTGPAFLEINFKTDLYQLMVTNIR